MNHIIDVPQDEVSLDRSTPHTTRSPLIRCSMQMTSTNDRSSHVRGALGECIVRPLLPIRSLMFNQISILALLVGTLALASPATAAAASVWSAPSAPIYPATVPYIDTESLSCTSASFCAAASTDGNLLTYNGKSWSAPVAVDSNLGEGITKVSCGSASFCMAATESETRTEPPFSEVTTWNGATWSAPSEPPVETDVGFGLSCPSTSFCMLVGGTESAIYNGSSWSKPIEVEPEEGAYGIYSGYQIYLETVSCTSSSYCVAVGEGQSGPLGAAFTLAAYVYNGTTWSSPPEFVYSLDAPNPVVSCPSAGFCALTGQQYEAQTGSVLTNNSVGTQFWEPPEPPYPEEYPVVAGPTVSCATASFCVLAGASSNNINANGNASIYSGGLNWSTATTIDEGSPIAAISCPSITFCMAIDYLGRTMVYSGNSPNPPPSSTSPPAISGNAEVWQSLSCNPGSWSGSPTPTISYQWQRDGAAIGGATGSNYTVEAADIGHALTCVVTADNSVGKTSAISAAVHVPVSSYSGGSCPDVAIFGARGSGEDNTASNVGMGPVPYQVAQEIRNRLPIGLRVEMIGVNYLAVGPLGAVANGSDYLNSVSTGAQVLVDGYNGQVGLVSLVMSCPKAEVVLIGLSQGSHVIHYAMSLAPTQPSAVTRRIAAILLFGDPVRQPHQSYNIGNQDASGVLSNLGPLPGNTGPPSIASYLEPVTQSYCLPKDPICDYTGLGDLAKNRGIHDGYGSSPYIAAAASFAVRHIRVALVAHAATAAVGTGARATMARAGKSHRNHPRHRCVDRQAGLYDAASVCPRMTHGTRPQRSATYRGSSRDGDKITMKASGNAASVSVKVVDSCGAVFTGSIVVTRGGIFDGTTPEGFEITGLFANKRIVGGTLTDPSCKSLPIRGFTLRRPGY